MFHIHPLKTRVGGQPTSRPVGQAENLHRSRSGRKLVLSLRAWLKRWRLDRELAAGGDPHEPLRRVRATKLTRLRTRRAIASRLESAIAAAESPPRRTLSPAIPVHRGAVREARPLILSLANALREQGRLSAQGIARAEMLVTDGGSSLYWDGSTLYGDNRPRDLPTDLRSAIAALHLGPKLEDDDYAGDVTPARIAQNEAHRVSVERHKVSVHRHQGGHDPTGAGEGRAAGMDEREPFPVTRPPVSMTGSPSRSPRFPRNRSQTGRRRVPDRA